MADKQCIIDDAYCVSMGTYFQRQGQELDRMVADYVGILENVRDTAILDGEVHSALECYIEYAKRLKDQIGLISDSAKSQLNNFLTRVDEADQYLF